MSELDGTIEGRVKFFNAAKGYGFVCPDSDPSIDIFVHYSAVQKDGYRTLHEGERVRFTLLDTPKGRQAVKVWPL